MCARCAAPRAPGEIIFGVCGEAALGCSLAEYIGAGEVCCGAALLGGAAAASRLQHKKPRTDGDLLHEVGASLHIDRQHEAAVRGLLHDISAANVAHREISVGDPLAPPDNERK